MKIEIIAVNFYDEHGVHLGIAKYEDEICEWEVKTIGFMKYRDIKEIINGLKNRVIE